MTALPLMPLSVSTRVVCIHSISCYPLSVPASSSHKLTFIFSIAFLSSLNANPHPIISDPCSHFGSIAAGSGSGSGATATMTSDTNIATDTGSPSATNTGNAGGGLNSNNAQSGSTATGGSGGPVQTCQN